MIRLCNINSIVGGLFAIFHYIILYSLNRSWGLKNKTVQYIMEFGVNSSIMLFDLKNRTHLKQAFVIRSGPKKRFLLEMILMLQTLDL